MFAGLPGTGIGGLFYLLLTIWMPVHEAYLLARGRSSVRRWKFIGMRWVVFSAIIGVIWLQTIVMRGLLPGNGMSGGGLAQAIGLDEQTVSRTSGGTMLLVAMASATALVLVIGGMHVLRAGVKVYDRARA